MDRARVRLGRLGAQQRGGEAAQLVRDREAAELVAEDRDEAVVGRVPAVEPVVDPAAERREQAERRRGGGSRPAESRRSSARIRSPAGRVTSSASRRTSRSVSSSSRSSSSSSSRTARSSRSGSSAEDALADRAQPARLEVAGPVERIDRLAAGQRSAIALIVKSRFARSSSIEPGSGVKSTVRPSVERDAPGAVLLGERERRAAGALREGAGGLPWIAHGDVEVDELAPEQLVAHGAADDPRLLAAQHLVERAQASTTTLRARRGSRVDPRGELVVDRLRHARVRLREDAVAEDRDRRADRLLALELDREGVHRDDADHAPRLAADAHLGAGQVAAKAVRVADRHDPDPRRLLGDERAAVAGALARLRAA